MKVKHNATRILILATATLAFALVQAQGSQGRQQGRGQYGQQGAGPQGGRMGGPQGMMRGQMKPGLLNTPLEFVSWKLALTNQQVEEFKKTIRSFEQMQQNRGGQGRPQHEGPGGPGGQGGPGGPGGDEPMGPPPGGPGNGGPGGGPGGDEPMGPPPGGPGNEGPGNDGPGRDGQGRDGQGRGGFGRDNRQGGPMGPNPKVKALIDATEKKLVSILKDDQRSKLPEFYKEVGLYRAARIPLDLVKDLNLSSQQISSLKQILEQNKPEREGDEPKMRPEEFHEAIQGILTDVQKEKIKNFRPKRQGPGGPGGPGGRGGNDRRGPGGPGGPGGQGGPGGPGGPGGGDEPEELI